jgi:hypothetical protein
MAETKESTMPTSSGVKELIDQLREQGVAAGRARATDIIHEAERKA